MTTAAVIASHVKALAPLLEQFDTFGPRYTSYPTAPQFTEDFTAREWQAALAHNRATRDQDHPISLYTHLPFCDTRCHFCGCFTIITMNRALHRQYLEALHREIALTAAEVDTRRPVVQFHLGGGTPNALTPEQLAALLAEYRTHYTFAPEAELAVELDPRDCTPEHLATFHALGFNRYSLGVQDFDPQVQEAINRIQSEACTRGIIETLRVYGHEAINVDLIYGLPYQTPESFARTIAVVLDLAPSRLALYSYAHVPWKSPQQRRFGELPRLEGQPKFALFLQAYHAFCEAGYVPIGFDHFARPEDELVLAQQAGELRRNFMGYTTQRGADVLAAGVSGIADLGDTYAQNAKKLPDYYRALEADQLPILRGLTLSVEDRLRRELIVDLTCNFTLDLPAYEAEWGIAFAEHFAEELAALETFVQQGLVTWTPERITVEPAGRFFVRNLCMLFDQYLAGAGRERRFSRTL